MADIMTHHNRSAIRELEERVDALTEAARKLGVAVSARQQAPVLPDELLARMKRKPPAQYTGPY